MSIYNNQLTMEQLFRNPKLNKVLPQFDRKTPLRNVYSGAEITRRVRDYLKGAIGGRADKDSDGDLLVNGKQQSVLERVKQLVPIMEQFFNNMPSIVKNLRNNTRIYTTCVSVGQIESVRKKVFFNEKIGLLKDVLDNINFNPDFNSMNSISNLSPSEFSRRQLAWFKKVGLKIQKLKERK